VDFAIGCLSWSFEASWESRETEVVVCVVEIGQRGQA
jgi:hypothetical protein